MRLVALVVLAGLAAGCSTPEASSAPREPIEAVEYRLSWEDGELDAGEGEWTVFDARGYEVVVERGRVMPYALSLVSCADAGEDPDEESTLWSWLAVEGRAWAGHGDAWDPSVVFGDVAEDVVDTSTHEFGSRELDPTPYCQFHYLIGPGLAPEGLGDGRELALHVEGRYRASGKQAWRAFTAYSAEATGRLFELEPVGGDRLGIELVRARASMFDGVAIDQLDAEALGLALMRNLARTARVEAIALD